MKQFMHMYVEEQVRMEISTSIIFNMYRLGTDANTGISSM